MKVVLTSLNSRHIHSTLALRYLEKSVSDVANTVVEEFTINQRNDLILRKLYEHKADLYAFSAYIWNSPMIFEIASNLKKLHPDAIIVFGGPEVGYDSIEFLRKYKFIDFIACGEGEESFRDLIIKLSEDIENIDSLMVDGMSSRKSEAQIIELDFNNIPFPYSEDDDITNQMVYYESSRGCPYRCSYCLSSSSKSTRFKPVEEVQKDIDFFMAKQPSIVKFIDRTFNLISERTVSIIEHIRKTDNGITTFHFEISPVNIDDDLVKALEGIRPGLIQFEIGVQSAHESVVKLISRKQSLHSYKNKLAGLMENKAVHMHLDLIAGLPGETYEMFLESVREVLKMNPDHFQLGMLKLLRGTNLRKDAEKYGYIFDEKPPYQVLANSNITYEQVCMLSDLEDVLEIYLNSEQFENTIKYMKSKGDLLGILLSFSKHLRSKGFFDAPRSQEQRYESFSEFLDENDKTAHIMLQLDFSLKKPGKLLNLPISHMEFSFKKFYASFLTEENIKSQLEWLNGLKITDIIKKTMILAIDDNKCVYIVDSGNKKIKMLEIEEWSKYDH